MISFWRIEKHSMIQIMRNFTPLLGYKYKINEQLSYFINYTTHFETPTLYETGNSPELKPQRNQIRELGIFIENSLARTW